MLCPGPVDTNFNNVANVKFALSGIPADYCAYYALCKMFTGKLTIVPTFTMKAGVFGSRFLPRQVLAFMTGHQQKRRQTISDMILPVTDLEFFENIIFFLSTSIALLKNTSTAAL